MLVVFVVVIRVVVRAWLWCCYMALLWLSSVIVAAAIEVFSWPYVVVCISFLCAYVFFVVAFAGFSMSLFYFLLHFMLPSCSFVLAIVECDDERPCPKHAHCRTKKRNRVCVCRFGYRGNGKICKGIDEMLQLAMVQLRLRRLLKSYISLY